MSFLKVTVTRDEAGAITGGTQEALGFVDRIVQSIKAPLNVTSDTDVLVTEQQEAMTAIVWGLGGFVGGDAFGNNRGLKGKGPLWKFGKV